MKIFAKEQLSPHKFKTKEGYLICTDAILARTGKQTYRKGTFFPNAKDADIEIEVDRPEKEVCDATAVASFENKPVCLDHPDVDVNSKNYKELAVGFVRDVAIKDIDGQKVMTGNLVITDADAITAIESGQYGELSCGYDCEVLDEDNPAMTHIRGNHVALCEQGRAGIAKIRDSIKDTARTITVQCYILSKDGKQILTQERPGPSWPGIAVPGGHVRANETPLEACVREVREETGLEVRQLELFGTHQYECEEDGPSIAMLYKTTDSYGDLQVNSDEGLNQWYDIDEVLKSPKCAEGFQEMLSKCINNSLVVDSTADSVFSAEAMQNKYTTTYSAYDCIKYAHVGDKVELIFNSNEVVKGTVVSKLNQMIMIKCNDGSSRLLTPSNNSVKCRFVRDSVMGPHSGFYQMHKYRGYDIAEYVVGARIITLHKDFYTVKEAKEYIDLLLKKHDSVKDDDIKTIINSRINGDLWSSPYMAFDYAAYLTNKKEVDEYIQRQNIRRLGIFMYKNMKVIVFRVSWHSSKGTELEHILSNKACIKVGTCDDLVDEKQFVYVTDSTKDDFTEKDAAWVLANEGHKEVVKDANSYLVTSKRYDIDALRQGFNVEGYGDTIRVWGPRWKLEKWQNSYDADEPISYAKIKDSIKDRRWEIGQRVRYEGSYYYVINYSKGEWVLEDENTKEQIRVSDSIIKDDHLSPMTYKKLKELGYSPDDWKEWSQEEANKKILSQEKKSEKKEGKSEEGSKEEPKQENNFSEEEQKGIKEAESFLKATKSQYEYDFKQAAYRLYTRKTGKEPSEKVKEHLDKLANKEYTRQEQKREQTEKQWSETDDTKKSEAIHSYLEQSSKYIIKNMNSRSIKQFANRINSISSKKEADELWNEYKDWRESHLTSSSRWSDFSDDEKFTNLLALKMLEYSPNDENISVDTDTKRYILEDYLNDSIKDSVVKDDAKQQLISVLGILRDTWQLKAEGKTWTGRKHFEFETKEQVKDFRTTMMLVDKAIERFDDAFHCVSTFNGVLLNDGRINLVVDVDDRHYHDSVKDAKKAVDAIKIVKSVKVSNFESKK